MEYYISVEFVSLIILQYSMYITQAYNLLHYLNQKTSWVSPLQSKIILRGQEQMHAFLNIQKRELNLNFLLGGV